MTTTTVQKKWKRLAVPVLFVFLFLYIITYIKPALFQHVQQTPFLRNSEYFSRFLDHPGGIIQYFSHFVMQWMISGVGGTLIILATLLLLYFLYARLLNIFIKQAGMIWPTILVLGSLAIMHDYYFPFLVLLENIIVLLALLAYGKFGLKRSFGWITFLVLYILTYYLAGSGSGLVFAVSSIVLILLAGEKKLILLSCAVLASLLIPFLAYHFAFNINRYDAYLWFIPDLSITVDYKITNWFYLYLALVPILMISGALLSSPWEKFTKKVYERIGIISLIIIGILMLGASTYGLLKLSSKPIHRTAVLCDYFNYQGEFQRTIDLAVSTKDNYDISVNVSFVRALAKRGELTKGLFDYPQLLGSQIMQPDKLGSPIYMMAASDFYLDLGYVSEAQHFAYANLAINPDNLRSKKRLVITNILLGNYGAAETYLKSLALSFHQEEFVDRYMKFVKDSSLAKTDPYIMDKRQFIPGNFPIPVMMTERLKDLIKYNDSNILAYECLQLCHLMDHNLNLFMNELSASLKFYNQVPDLYQQALMVYYFNTEQEGLSDFGIDSFNKQTFNTFVSTIAASGNNREMARGSLNPLSNTYMYYITYLSPKVTNVKLIQQ